MTRTLTHLTPFLMLGWLVPTSSPAQVPDSPMTRLRPIGAPSAVDQLLLPSNASRGRETAYQSTAVAAETATGQANRYDSAVQQTVLLQQFDAPQLPGSIQTPGGFSLPTAPSPMTTPPPQAQPRSLPVNPGTLAPVPLDRSGRIPSSSDLAPLAQPQLNDGFATIDNCPCVSPPSDYVAATPWGPCAPVSYQSPQAYVDPQTQFVPPPTQIVAPSFVPVVPVTPKSAGVPHGALISFGQERNPVQVGQGIIGQPVAYVPGQKIRNWVRYFFP